MASEMMRRVNDKLSRGGPDDLTPEEAEWLRARLDKINAQMDGLQPGEKVIIAPIDNEKDDWVAIRKRDPR